MKKIAVLLFCISSFSITNAQKLNSNEKIHGLSFVASNNTVTKKTIEPVLKTNANWVALMPFGFMQQKNQPNLKFNTQWQWFGEKAEGVKQTSTVFKQNQIKLMLKPQIWIRNGTFTGEIDMPSENDWLVFEKEYEKFILFYAKIAETEQMELFCIGTELSTFITKREHFWNALIDKIRKVYQGKITYAANWDSFSKTNFWKKLDAIGIDAYFPLSDEKTPNYSSLVTAWKPIKNQLHNFSIKYQKPIIFTEYGYRSIDYTAKKPWESYTKAAYNVTAQKNGIQAIYTSFWNEDWFQGGFLWKWFDQYETTGGKNDTGYTLQNKESELILKKLFSN